LQVQLNHITSFVVCKGVQLKKGKWGEATNGVVALNTIDSSPLSQTKKENNNV
jgi:hypothetical protein